MKNLFTRLTILILASILVLTSVNAQNYWLNDADYITPLNNRNVFLGDVPPYEGGGMPHVHDDEFNYRIKLLELGGDNGGLYSFTSLRPSLHAITTESSAVYAQTAGVGPAVLGVSKQNVNLLGIDGESSSLRNLEAGVAGVGYSTGVYGYGNLLGGWFNAEEGAGLYVTSASGLAAQFDGNVNVKVGYINVGLGTDNGASIQTLTTDNTIGIYAESTQATAIKGESGSSYGIYGESYSGRGVYGTSTMSRGVEGVSVNNHGVVGLSQNNIGVYGESGTTTAVKGFSEFGYGAYFETIDGAAALYAYDRNGGNKAAHFEGDVQLNGSITGNIGPGAIKIQTTQGYTEIGALNQWNTHFRTDMPQFYFNKKVRVAGNIRADGKVYSQGIELTSDQRLKKDVQPFGYGLDAVMQMNPLTYDYTGEGGTKSGGYNVGLFAQDLQEIAPEFVTEFTHQEFDENSELKSEEDYLQVYDTGIKYMLVNATKEQQEIIDNQSERIETLEETLAELRATVEALVGSAHQIIDLGGVSGKMLQNQPNPFKGTTLIQYNIAEDTGTAFITIYNLNGQLMHREYLAQKGMGEVQLQAGSLPAGTYSYTLTIDGQLVDTKQMVITK